MGCISHSCQLLANSVRKISLTNSLRGIQHAWHFCYALDFGVEVLCGGLVIACFTP
ncbi:TPA: DUF3265 domain-containing protein [Vibrio vulnificus]|nr:DUF3265 domain-containing protein [Vibrio vulnificus]HAS6295382.1 DUF3265 domain-containing protein [Vibrio vulnificus]HAS6318440.1 DUF3265 domain-containing protein [Vibrio vulnificus]HDY7558489.1 DUF3265 domain-containing protein [Vibrio vulnificus]HDY7576616.1 DUF3265 domain-containing protein [Vibrio vulnificus]